MLVVLPSVVLLNFSIAWAAFVFLVGKGRNSDANTALVSAYVVMLIVALAFCHFVRHSLDTPRYAQKCVVEAL